MKNYYESIKTYDSIDIGIIYCEDEKPYWFQHYKSILEFKEKGLNFFSWFKPSTKEAYDKQQNTLKMEENDDWCIKCTKENGKILADWGDKYSAGWNGDSINSYYGLEKGRTNCRSSIFGKLLSTEEFYQKIGHKVETSVVTKEYSTGIIEDLKVGDKVRAIDQSYSWGQVKKGDVGIISSATKDFYVVNFPTQKSWHGKRKDFEKITEEISKSKEESLLEEAKRRYPIGTIVKKIDYNRGGNFGYEVRFTQCKYYSDTDYLFIDGNLLIYAKGKWAEIENSKYVGGIDPYKVVPQAPAVIQPVLKSLEENDERIDTSINRISSVSNNLVLEEV